MEGKMIPLAEPYLNKKELEYVTDCIKTTWISSIGGYVTKFEERFAKFCGRKYGIATSNGTTALHLALVSLNIAKGGEVLVPDLTFIATANAVTYCGAKPVFVDAESQTWNIDPEKIEEKITKKTNAIIPVHLYGHPCEMDAVLEIAKKHDLYVVEDAAEAHGAEYKGKKVGGLSDVGCFSFYGNKIITTGEGGMIVTNDEELAEKARMLRDHAMSKDRRYWHLYVGYNYRMTNIQAAIGVAQLEKIEKIIEIKRKNAILYNSFLKNVEGITLPPEAPWAKNVYWMYSVLIGNEFGIKRDEVIARLKKRGIDSRPFFYPLHIQPPYAKGNREKFTVAEELARKGINLPSAASLKKNEIKYIAETISSLKR